MLIYIIYSLLRKEGKVRVTLLDTRSTRMEQLQMQLHPEGPVPNGYPKPNSDLRKPGNFKKRRGTGLTR